MLAQDNSTQLAATLELNVSKEAFKAFQFFDMITSNGKRPFGQSLSKITAVSGNVDQSKPDSHFNLYIDPYIHAY